MESNNCVPDVCRRKEQRFPVNTPATLVNLEAPETPVHGCLVNLSANGLLFQTSLDLRIGEGSQVALQFQSATVVGEVRHVASRSDAVSVGVLISDAQFQSSAAAAAA